jgi:RHS repeat-associated protein
MTNFALGDSFKYDPSGHRIYKSSSAGTSIYVYDGENLIEETNSSGAAVARYSQTQNIDEPLAMLRSGATSYYQADALGSVTSLSNAAGTLAQSYTYDSFGKQTASSGSLTNPFQYTARESDTETGLYYYRARYYDASSGRFISEDPIGFRGGINKYGYVLNRPVVFSDPLGLCQIDPLQIGCTLCKARCLEIRALMYIGCFYWVLKGGDKGPCFGGANGAYALCLDDCQGSSCGGPPNAH